MDVFGNVGWVGMGCMAGLHKGLSHETFLTVGDAHGNLTAVEGQGMQCLPVSSMTEVILQEQVK